MQMSFPPTKDIKPTPSGLLIGGGIIGTLAFIPLTLVSVALWLVGLQITIASTILVYAICYLAIWKGIRSFRPGKGLPANFGG